MSARSTSDWTDAKIMALRQLWTKVFPRLKSDAGWASRKTPSSARRIVSICRTGALQ
jgi:hypothetical protein